MNMELDHWFVTARGVVHSRWEAAFGRVTALTLPPSATDLSKGAGTTLLWLETSIKDWPTVLRGLRHTGVPCVVLSMTPQVDEVALALDQGAKGYAHAWSTPVVLQQIAQVVTHGGHWVGAEFMQRLVAAAARIPPTEPGEDRDILLAMLSTREREVALAVAKGMTNKEVARELNITERTVKAHLAAVFEKLGVRDRLHLALKFAAAVDDKLPL